MPTLLETVRQCEAFRSRSEQLLRRAADGQPRALRWLHLSELLDCVAAAIVLEERALAESHWERFVAEGLRLEKDEGGFDAELNDAQEGLSEFTTPYLHLLVNVLNLELALGCRSRLEARPRLSELVDAADEEDGCLGHESYLVELALGRDVQAETLRSSRWVDWLNNQMVHERDREWEIAIALGQRRAQDFQRLVARYIEEEQETVHQHGPFGHHFTRTVLGLPCMALLRTAQECHLPFPSEFLSHFGLAELVKERKPV